ncbi:MAG: hypothetical protein JNK56_07155 [Myxococcales bacterium]|nr:hypothetical protein [Myxococcales bacterium]
MRSPRISLLALIALTACGANDAGSSTGDAATTGASGGATQPGASTAEAPTSAGTGDLSATATTSAGTLPDPTSDTGGDPPTSTSADLTTDVTTDPTADPGTDTGAGEACVDDHRVIAYVANWEECPTPAQMAHWSHAVVAFAVTYTWTPNGNLCDPNCQIGPVAGCNGKSLAELVADLHAADVKVLLSFGGAGMGGLWEGTCGQMEKCWDACLGRTAELVDSLTTLVVDNDLDGVDVDYEYCLHDAAHVGFVADLTTGLRAGLDALPGQPRLVTHAPMDHELDLGDPYFSIVADHADAIDFLMPQYYNGGMSPYEPAGLAAIETHYRDLVDGPFAGDASRVVFGHCIEPGCAPVATQPAALDVAKTVANWYPNDGGVFFWAAPYETDGAFSAPFRQHFDQAFCGG